MLASNSVTVEYRGTDTEKLSISRFQTFQSAEPRRYDQPMSEPVFYPRHVEHRLAGVRVLDS